MGRTRTRKRTTRWPKCVFQHTIDVTANNWFVLWCEKTVSVHANRRQFLKMLGAELFGGELDGSVSIKLTQIQIQPVPISFGGRLRCRQCISSKTVQRCKKCEKPLCINCALHNCSNCCPTERSCECPSVLVHSNMFYSLHNDTVWLNIMQMIFCHKTLTDLL